MTGALTSAWQAAGMKVSSKRIRMAEPQPLMETRTEATLSATACGLVVSHQSKQESVMEDAKCTLLHPPQTPAAQRLAPLSKHAMVAAFMQG